MLHSTALPHKLLLLGNTVLHKTKALNRKKNTKDGKGGERKVKSRKGKEHISKSDREKGPKGI